MSFDNRVGLAGLIVAFFGIAAMYLWPDKRWIGWLCLGVASILLTGWVVVEIKQRLGESWRSLGIAVLFCALLGGVIGALVWYSVRATRAPQITSNELRFIAGRHDTIRVTVNGQHFWTSLAFLDIGSFEKGWGIKGFPVRVYTEPNDSKPHVDTEVYSSELGLVKVANNQLELTPKGWDANANDRAIEIVNEHRIPVFQMILSAANQLDIYGVFSEAESKSGWRTEALFKYPSDEHQGEFDGTPDIFPLTAKSLYQLFLESCGSAGGSQGVYHLENPKAFRAGIDYKVCSDLDSRAAWLNIFIPKSVDAELVLKMFAPEYKEFITRSLQMGKAYIRLNPGQPPERGSKLVFTGVIGIYHEGILMPEQQEEIRAEFEKHGAHVRFYGDDYVIAKNSPLAGTR